MRSSAALKAQTIAAFRHAPDFSVVDSLNRAAPSEQTSHLRWLDQSGLALYLLHRLAQHHVAHRLPASFRESLDQRQASNQARTADLFGEFRRIVSRFASHKPGINFCALKGFSLVPDSCPAPHLRHQTDFDFLVAPDFLAPASRILESLGYAQTEMRSTGQVTFATPLRHIPTAHDDIYALPLHREVDLLPSLEFDFHGASLSTPSTPLASARMQSLEDFSFPVLAPEDAFSLQVLHTFSHFLGSWLRLSWLVEISHILEAHRDNAALWRAVILRNSHETCASASGNDNPRQAFGLILSLTHHLFATLIPEPLARWCAAPRSLRAPIAAWVSQFGDRFAQADLNGSKLTIFIHSHFIHDRQAWRRYLLSRLFPIGRNSSIGRVSIASRSAKIKAQVSQWLHSMRRGLFHTRELVSLPVEFIRWKRALLTQRKQRALVPPQLDPQRTDTPSTAALAGLARLPD
jgi:hypothetical protein